jgi:Kef-type K+ transport system membrane component KefB
VLAFHGSATREVHSAPGGSGDPTADLTLNELGHSKLPSGQLTILVGSIGELVTIVLLTAFGFHHQYGLGLQLAYKIGELGLVFVAAYGLLLLLRVLIWWWPERFARLVRQHDPSEIGVRAGMATMLVFVAFAALLGVEAILGAFVAGALFSFVFREKGVLETKLASVGFGFFVPLFFISVGAEFDLGHALRLDTLGRFGWLFAASVLVKLLPALLLCGAGLRLREAVGSGLLLAAPLTLLVAISRLGVSLKVIDSGTASAVVLLAVGSGVFLPWLYRLLLPPARAVER